VSDSTISGASLSVRCAEAKGVLPGANGTATFSEATTATTVNTRTLKLMGRATSTTIQAEVNWPPSAPPDTCRSGVGTVWINEHTNLASEMPHGGFKQSGYGKDMSAYAVEDYTVVKHVMAKLA
jgi:hypothetical protein